MTKRKKQGPEEAVRRLSTRQKNAVNGVMKNLAEKGGKTKGAILKDAGYSEAVQKTPEKVFGSKKIIDALEAIGVDNEMLAIKQKSHLNARKIEIKDTWIPWDEYQNNQKGVKEIIEEELEEDMPGARIVRIISRMGRDQTEYVSVKFSYPEYSVQQKSIDQMHKILGNYAPEKVEHSATGSLLDLF